MAIYKDVEPFIKWLEKEIEQFGEPNISIRPVAYGSENALRSVLNKSILKIAKPLWFVKAVIKWRT